MFFIQRRIFSALPASWPIKAENSRRPSRDHVQSGNTSSNLSGRQPLHGLSRWFQFPLRPCGLLKSVMKLSGVHSNCSAGQWTESIHTSWLYPLPPTIKAFDCYELLNPSRQHERTDNDFIRHDNQDSTSHNI